MKRMEYIYDKVCNIDNIKVAIMRSSLGKRGRPFVKRILDDIDIYAENIQKMLLNKSYVPSPYTIKII